LHCRLDKTPLAAGDDPTSMLSGMRLT
jgi:hypothetical protein